jgi:hypothetical protein
MPEPEKLARDIETKQRKMDELRENYTFHEVVLTDELDPKGAVKSSETTESDVFFVNGYRVSRLLKKNGKELTEKEARSEQARIRKLVEEDLKAPPGHSFNRRGENTSVSQILPLVRISNPRRVTLNGRLTLTYDFVGNPHVKAHGLAENAARRIMGTVWIDEEDRQVARLDAHFDDTFRIGGGLLASIQKGTSLIFEQSRLNADLWMPSVSDIHLAARELLVKGVRQNIHIKDTDFHRFDIGVHQEVGAPAP